MSHEASPSSQNPSIMGLGTVVVDHQVFLKRLPDPDSKTDVLEDRFQVGGPVPTALCFLKRLGWDCLFQGQWAQDSHGTMIEKDLRTHGVEFIPPPLRNPESRSGFAHVWVEQASGRRTIAAFRGSHVIESRDLQSDLMSRCQALHLDGWSGPAAIRAAQQIKRQGGRVFLDLGSPKPDLMELLLHVDLVNCPGHLFQRAFGIYDPEQGARHLMTAGPTEVCVTFGEEGAWYFNADQSLHQPAFPVEAIDTNGSGDVHAGALIYATLQGWTPGIKMKFAAAAAALKCRKTGNRDALPHRGEIEDFLREQGSLVPPIPGGN